jgi:class 3 adenylate cyclase
MRRERKLVTVVFVDLVGFTARAETRDPEDVEAILLDARPEMGEGIVAGDVVNTAARLQAGAPVNGILVGGQTYRATRHVIDYGEAEPVQAKGSQNRSRSGRRFRPGRVSASTCC